MEIVDRLWERYNIQTTNLLLVHSTGTKSDFLTGGKDSYPLSASSLSTSFTLLERKFFANSNLLDRSSTVKLRSVLIY